ncbi:MAG: FAD-dependent monooxygenase, partial [Betaproteobacteria bacterium]|nr:FAD-dependent monooxygenase [Betaproteobacteria bacterium]
MLRLTELKLPLDHAPDALPPAICQRLGIAADDLLGFTVFKRSHDARRKSAIVLIYQIDVELRDEVAVSARLKDDRQVLPTPDMDYKFVAHAPAALKTRPVVVGTGPCGLMAGLLLAQMGFKPIILERGKAVRERTKDTWGLWREHHLNP